MKLNEIVNANDVRVAKQPGLLYFTNEITKGDGVIGKLGRKTLDGYSLLEVLVLGQPDYAATTPAQFLF